MNARRLRCLLDLWEWFAAGAVSVAAVASLVAFLVVAARQPAGSPVSAVSSAARAYTCLVGVPSGAGDAASALGACPCGACRREATSGLLQKLSLDPSCLDGCDAIPVPERRVATLSLACGVTLLWLVSLMLIGNPLEPLWRTARNQARRGHGPPCR